MEYLNSMKLNTSHDKRIEKFDLEKEELIDYERGIFGAYPKTYFIPNQ